MSDWASPDYEPTPEEAADAFSYFENAEPGHGTFTISAGVEKWLWTVDGVWFSRRCELPDGRIQFDWLIPRSLH